MHLFKQINNLVKSSFFHLRNIAKVRNYLSDDVCKILIQSLVCSKIYNCNARLYDLSKHIINKFQSVQNAAARIIAKQRKNITFLQFCNNYTGFLLSTELCLKLTY